MVAEILYGGSWQGRGTHSERKAHLNLLDQAMECSVLSLPTALMARAWPGTTGFQKFSDQEWIG